MRRLSPASVSHTPRVLSCALACPTTRKQLQAQWEAARLKGEREARAAQEMGAAK